MGQCEGQNRKSKHCRAIETLAAVLLTAGSGAAAEVPTISFYGLKPIGLPAGLAESLQEHLEASLFRAGGNYDIMSRTDMDKILAEHRFQQSGVCTESECIEEAAAILGIDKMVTGTISRVGKTYSVVLKLIDVKHGRLEATVSRQYAGAVDSLLVVCEEAIRELLGPSEPEPVEVAQPVAEPVVASRADSVPVPIVKAVAAAPRKESEEELRKRKRTSRRLGIGAAAILIGVAAVVTTNAVQ